MTSQVIAWAIALLDTAPMVITTAQTIDRPATDSRRAIRRFYLAAALAGTVIPWIFFGSFVAAEGVDLVAFVRALFPNGAAGGLTADILVSSSVFWVWSYRDSRVNGITRWWLVVPATLLVGLSLAFPLYLYRRELAAASG